MGGIVTAHPTLKSVLAACREFARALLIVGKIEMGKDQGSAAACTDRSERSGDRRRRRAANVCDRPVSAQKECARYAKR